MSQDAPAHGSPGLTANGPAHPTLHSGIADTLVRGGAIGALVGATAALARTVGPVRTGAVSGDQAAREILIGAGKSGLATGLGAAVAGAIRGGPLVSALAMVATGAAALYALERPARQVAPASDQAAPEALSLIHI